MPFLTFICKNPTPHKTVVFVPAGNMGSNSPAGGGGNPAGGVNPATAGGTAAVITCPQCAFTAQSGDGNMSSVSNGVDGMKQEVGLINDTGSPPSGGANIVPPTANADSAIRVPVGSPGNVGSVQTKGPAIQRLDSAGFKDLL